MRIKTIRDFKRGDKVIYRFPSPKEKGRDFLVGYVFKKGKNFLEIRSNDNLKLTIYNQNLENIEQVERINHLLN